jgi:UDP-2-acetamido-3-amino-2,3-dideoxy-glucuronate N-acetyltransferase
MTAPMIHPTACVDPTATIGEGVKVWHFCNIQKNAVVGPRCVLGQNVNVGNDVRIGANCKIQNNVSVFNGVTLEDDVFCGPSMVFTNVLNPRSHVSRRDEFRTTLVKRGATLGANCTVVCGTTIGEYAMVGAGSVVTRDLEPFGLYVGSPARHRGFVCQCGDLIKAELSVGQEYECTRCGWKYRRAGHWTIVPVCIPEGQVGQPQQSV